MTKALPTESLRRDGRLFINLNVTSDWLCRSLLGVSRGRHPLKQLTATLEGLKETALRSLRSSQRSALDVATALAAAEDPMVFLDSPPSALADDAVTPKKDSKRRRRTAAPTDSRGAEVRAEVRVGDAVADTRVFPACSRAATVAKTFRVLVTVSNRRRLYVDAEDLDVLLELLFHVCGRHGVPCAEVTDPDEVTGVEWFDARTSRWHRRDPGTGAETRSEAVSRVDARKRPLSAEDYADAKAACLRAWAIPA